MPYGVGGAIAEGLQSGFEMGRSINQDAERKREFEVDAAIKREQADRLWQQEKDRYGRMQDAAQVQATQDQLAQLDKLAQGMQERGLTVSPELNMQRAQLAQQLAQMHGQIATIGRLAQAQPAGVTGAAPRPNVASADLSGASAPAPTAPLPDLSQAGPAPAIPPGVAGGPQATSAPAPGGGGAMGVQGVQGAQPQPPPGLGPQSGPVGMGVDGLVPAGVSSGGALPAGAAAAPAPAVSGGAPQAASVASPTTSAVTPQQTLVTQTDQDAQDLASRLHTGQVSLTDVAPKDLALMVASATKHPPDDLSALNQGLADFNAGVATGNNGLMIQGLNGVYGPSINTGVGQPSQYGGNVVSKKIVGLDPALSADGTVHPDRVMVRQEVTTDQTGPDGTPAIYHAPLLGADGKVAAIPLTDAFNHVGAMGALTATLAHPDAQAALAQGAKDPAVKAYFDAYNSMAAPLSKADVLENQIQATMQRTGKPRGEVEQMYRNAGAIPWQLSVPHGVGQSDAAFIQDIMQHNPGMSYEDAAALAQRTTHAITKYSPGAGGGAGVQGSGSGGLPGATGPAGAPTSPDDFLAKLSPEDRQSVLTAARDPSTLANISTAKGRREHVQNLLSQYLQTQNAQGSVMIGKGTAGIDAQGNPVGGINPASVDFFTTLALGGDQSWRTGLGRSGQGAEMIRAVDNNMPKLAASLNLSAADIGTNKAQLAALNKTLTDRTKYVTAVDQLNGTLDRQASLVQSLLAKGGATEGGPLFNKPYNVVRQALGSVDAHNLDVALVGLAREHQRVIVSPLSNGQLAVQAQQTGDKLVNLDLTPSQIMGTIGVMKTEAANAKTQGAETLEFTRQQVHNLFPDGAPKAGGVQGAAAPPVGAKPTQIQTAADYAALPSGAQYIDPTGVARTKQ